MTEEQPSTETNTRADNPREVDARNIRSSIAGASSGEFHIYRHERRREGQRIAQMENEAKEKEEREAKYEEALKRKRKEELRTEKLAAKRKRKKQTRMKRRQNRSSTNSTHVGDVTPVKTSNEKPSETNENEK